MALTQRVKHIRTRTVIRFCQGKGMSGPGGYSPSVGRNANGMSGGTSGRGSPRLHPSVCTPGT
jgi:hypothetical protein